MELAKKAFKLLKSLAIHVAKNGFSRKSLKSFIKKTAKEWMMPDGLTGKLDDLDAAGVFGSVMSSVVDELKVWENF